MKLMWLVLASALIFIATACGNGNSSRNTVTGNWTAALSDPSGAPAFAFTTSLKQNSGSSAVDVKLRLFTSTALLPLFCFSDVVNAKAGAPLGSDRAAVQFPVTVFLEEFPFPQAVAIKIRADASTNHISFINHLCLA